MAVIVYSSCFILAALSGSYSPKHYLSLLFQSCFTIDNGGKKKDISVPVSMITSTKRAEERRKQQEADNQVITGSESNRY